MTDDNIASAPTSKRGLLLSGGLDSTAMAAWLRPEYAIVIDYGQVCAHAEYVASQAVAEALGLRLIKLRVDCGCIGSGDLSGRPSIEKLSPSPEWWPFRNQLLATLAASAALHEGITELLFATVRSDGFHMDGTPAFFDKLNLLLRMQEGGLGVSAPAINYSTVELIQAADVDMQLLGWTHSCHTSNLPCGRCRGCNKRADALWTAGLWP
jgi:7-cyano-7-deazaguanine synthase